MSWPVNRIRAADVARRFCSSPTHLSCHPGSHHASRIFAQTMKETQNSHRRCDVPLLPASVSQRNLILLTGRLKVSNTSRDRRQITLCRTGLERVQRSGLRQPGVAAFLGIEVHISNRAKGTSDISFADNRYARMRQTGFLGRWRGALKQSGQGQQMGAMRLSVRGPRNLCHIGDN